MPPSSVMRIRAPQNGHGNAFCSGNLVLSETKIPSGGGLENWSLNVVLLTFHLNFFFRRCLAAIFIPFPNPVKMIKPLCANLNLDIWGETPVEYFVAVLRSICGHVLIFFHGFLAFFRPRIRRPADVFDGVGAMRGATEAEIKRRNHPRPTNYFKYERVLSGAPDRDFCMSIQDRYFRRLEIDLLRDTNTEFGHERQPYSKWLYKGGPNCIHAWRKYLVQGDVIADQGMAEGTAGIPPKQLPNSGYYSPETMRGVSLKFVVLDEYGSMKSEVWEQIIRPALADQKGSALFIGTPLGRNHFYELFTYGESGNDSEFKSWHFTSFDNELLDPKEIEAAKKSMSSFAFRQEFMASFEAASGGIFKEITHFFSISKMCTCCFIFFSVFFRKFSLK